MILSDQRTYASVGALKVLPRKVKGTSAIYPHPSVFSLCYFFAKIVASRSPLSLCRSRDDNSVDDNRFNFPYVDCGCERSAGAIPFFSHVRLLYSWLLTNVESLLSNARNKRTFPRDEKEAAEGKPMSRSSVNRSPTIFDEVYKRSALRRTSHSHLVWSQVKVRCCAINFQ